MGPNKVRLYPYVKRILECAEHTETPRGDRYSKQYYKITRYIDFRSTMNLGTYTLIHILHISMYLHVYLFACIHTNICVYTYAYMFLLIYLLVFSVSHKSMCYIKAAVSSVLLD